MRLLVGLIGLATAGLAMPAAAANSAASKACSEQADARNLHGADRDVFRTQCMKATGADTAAPAKPAAEPRPAPAPKAATTTTTTTKSTGSDQSKACSAQADAKGLHGAERDSFRTSCMKGTAPATAAKATPAAKPAATTTTTTTTTKPVASDASKACSAQADAKGLHGAERDSFRTACMKGAAPAATKAVAPSVAPAAPTAAVAASTASTKAPPSDISKACSAQADAKGLHGAERDSFRTSCMKGTPVAKPVAPMATTSSTTTAKTTTKTVDTAPALATPSGGKPLSPAQEAANARIKDCGEQWRTAKAANKIPAGQTWPQYWSACSARMKAAGH